MAWIPFSSSGAINRSGRWGLRRKKGKLHMKKRIESKFLAYSRIEVEEICKKAKLNLLSFSTRDVFFFAQITGD